MPTWTFIKRGGAPAGAIKISVGGDSFLIDDASNTAISTTDPHTAQELADSSVLQLQGGSPTNVATQHSVIAPQVVDGLLVVPAGAGQWTPVTTPIAAPTYGTTVTPDVLAGDARITVTNATAFTIAAPVNPPPANARRPLVIEVKNSSGGAMGVITWAAAYVFAGFVWANPANGKSRYAKFEWNGSVWVCKAVSTADY